MKLTRLLYLMLLLFSPFVSYAASYEIDWFLHPVREHFYEIKNENEYDGLIHLVNEQAIYFVSDTISITSKLNLQGRLSISSFSGHLMGNGNTISNLKNPLISNILSDGIVENINFDNSCGVSSGSDIGMVARKCQGVIKNCTSYATISYTSSDYFRAAGICGNLSGGKIMGCKNYGKITGSISGSNLTVMRVGGICGYIGDGSMVIGCVNYGNVSASAYAYAIAGGIVGDSQSSSLIENCINRGEIVSTITGTSSLTSSKIIQYTGGIAGQEQFGGTINMCSNFGSVSNNTQYVSGIVGHAGKSSIINCSNHATITSTENYFFSCACGICSYYDGVESEGNYVFANCINTGTVSSKTKNAIATAAGICNNIKYATIANLLNNGSVNASAYGVSSAQFSIHQYEHENCNVLSSISTIEEANNFIDNYTGYLQFVKWFTDDNNQIALSNTFSYFVEPYEGYAEVHCFSDDGLERYTLSFTNNIPDITFTESTIIPNLTPSTEYNYTILSNKDNKPIKGKFKTQDIAIGLSIDTIAFTTVSLNLNLTARGCEIIKRGIKYRRSDSSEWKYVYSKDNAVLLTELSDNTTYDIKPCCEILGVEFEGEYSTFTTNELIPQISKTTETSSSLIFSTTNLSDLKGYNYGILLENDEYMPDDAGSIVLSNLDCDKVYSLSVYIYKSGSRFEYHLGSFTTINFETGEALQVSPSAAMVKVRVGAKQMSDYPYNKYTDYKVEVRCITDPEPDNNVIVLGGLTPIYTGHTYEYCITFDCPQSQIYQYRLRVGTTRTYYGKYDYLYGEWKTVDPNTPNVSVVEPLFSDIKTTQDTNGFKLSCSNVPGEEKINSKGLEYRVSTSNEYIRIPLYDSDGILYKTFKMVVFRSPKQPKLFRNNQT